MGGSRLFLSPSEQQRDTKAQETRSLGFAWPGSLVSAAETRMEQSPQSPSCHLHHHLALQSKTCAKCRVFLFPKRGPQVSSSFDPFQPTALQGDIFFPPVGFKPCSKASWALLRQVPMARNIPTGRSGTTRRRRSHSCAPRLPTSLPHIAGGSPGTRSPAQNSSVCRMKLGACNILILTSGN